MKFLQILYNICKGKRDKGRLQMNEKKIEELRAELVNNEKIHKENEIIAEEYREKNRAMYNKIFTNHGMKIFKLGGIRKSREYVGMTKEIPTFDLYFVTPWNKYEQLTLTLAIDDVMKVVTIYQYRMSSDSFDSHKKDEGFSAFAYYQDVATIFNFVENEGSQLWILLQEYKTPAFAKVRSESDINSEINELMEADRRAEVPLQIGKYVMVNMDGHRARRSWNGDWRKALVVKLNKKSVQFVPIWQYADGHEENGELKALPFDWNLFRSIEQHEAKEAERKAKNR